MGAPITYTDPVFTEAGLLGGDTAGAALHLYSSSVGGGNDSIQFHGSAGLATPAISNAGPTTIMPSWAEFDNYGRYIQIVGEPTTFVFPNGGGTWTGGSPLDIFNQPVGTDTSFNITGTYDGEITANMMTATVYASGNQQYPGGGSVTAFLGSAVARDGNSGVQGVTGLAAALATGAIAVAGVFAACTYAPGTDTIALLLLNGGDSTNATNSLLTLSTGAEGNSANNLIVVEASNLNPCQPGGSIMTIAGSHHNSAFGIDFSAAHFTDAAFKSPNFKIAADGSVYLGVNTRLMSVRERVSLWNGSASLIEGNVSSPSLFLANYCAAPVMNLQIMAWTGSAWASVGGIGNNGSTTSFYTTSDRRLKTLHGRADARRLLSGVAVHNGSFVAKPDVNRHMFLADELQKGGFGYAVWGDPDGPEPQMVDHSALVPALWSVVSDHEAELSDHEIRIALLENTLAQS